MFRFILTCGFILLTPLSYAAEDRRGFDRIPCGQCVTAIHFRSRGIIYMRTRTDMQQSVAVYNPDGVEVKVTMRRKLGWLFTTDWLVKIDEQYGDMHLPEETFTAAQVAALITRGLAGLGGRPGTSRTPITSIRNMSGDVWDQKSSSFTSMSGNLGAPGGTSSGGNGGTTYIEEEVDKKAN